MYVCVLQAVKQGVHRVPSSTETLRLPFGHKTTLTQSNSLGSVLATPPRHHEVTGSASMEMSSLNIYQNRSPTLTPKLSLTPTNSHDSTASNGRSSPNVGAPSPSSGQETQVLLSPITCSFAVEYYCMNCVYEQCPSHIEKPRIQTTR